MKGRIHTLDYLRGLSALGILLFHYLSWTYGDFKAGSFLGRFGYYGVSIFYILSGLTLYHVYYEKLKPAVPDLLSYFKKRVFRIYPLLWVTTIAAMILWSKYDWSLLFLNLTGLFGFVKWWAYLSPGVWSIGNEIVFYTLFPFFVYFDKRKKILLILCTLFLLGAYIYFAFWALPQAPYLQLWRVYTNPLNQAFLFLSGFLMAKFFQKLVVNPQILLLIFLIGTGILCFYPVQGERLNLVTYWPRLVFTFSCLLICFSFYKFQASLPGLLHRPLALLGGASYSIYLLHPVLFGITSFGFAYLANRAIVFPVILHVVVPLVATIIVSYFSYRYFERYFIEKVR